MSKKKPKKTLSWSTWLATTRKILADNNLPITDEFLMRYWENGNSPLQAFESIARKQP